MRANATVWRPDKTTKLIDRDHRAAASGKIIFDGGCTTAGALTHSVTARGVCRAELTRHGANVRGAPRPLPARPERCYNSVKLLSGSPAGVSFTVFDVPSMLVCLISEIGMWIWRRP